MKYISFLIAGLVMGLAVWFTNPRIETVTETHTVTVIDSILVPGATVIKYATVENTVYDTVLIVETKTKLCTVQVEADFPIGDDGRFVGLVRGHHGQLAWQPASAAGGYLAEGHGTTQVHVLVQIANHEG